MISRALNHMLSPARERSAPGQTSPLVEALQPFYSWICKVLYLVSREFGGRHKRSARGALISLAEPMIIVTTMSVIRWTINGVTDWDEMVYQATGVIPFFYFLHLSLMLLPDDADGAIPTVTFFDRLLAKVISETLIKTIAMIVLMSLCNYMGARKALPNDPTGCLLPAACLMLFGAAVGVSITAISRKYPAFIYFYGFSMRMLLFTSGVIIRPDIIPTRVRWIVEYNPIFHAINWFRLEWFASFPSTLLDKGFFFNSCMVSMFVAFFLYRNVGR